MLFAKTWLKVIVLGCIQSHKPKSGEATFIKSSRCRFLLISQLMDKNLYRLLQHSYGMRRLMACSGDCKKSKQFSKQYRSKSGARSRQLRHVADTKRKTSILLFFASTDGLRLPPHLDLYCRKSIYYFNFLQFPYGLQLWLITPIQIVDKK